MGKLTYDATRRIAWLRMQFTSEDSHKVQSFSGLHPTNVGSVQVHCYALMPDFERYVDVFSEIVTSVQIDDEWKYRDRSAAAAFFDTPRASGAVGGIVAAIVLGLLRRRRVKAKTANRQV